MLIGKILGESFGLSTIWGLKEISLSNLFTFILPDLNSILGLIYKQVKSPESINSS